VLRSEWQCTLEKATTMGPRHAVRMGLRYVRGLGRKQADSLLGAREHHEFASVQELVRRTELDEGSLARLAEAGAMRGLAGSRRQALWEVRGAHGEEVGALALDAAERRPAFVALDRFDSIDWDYRTARHSTQGHPLAPLREEMQRKRWPDANALLALGDGARVHYAGLVICRQRPGTASGVLFMTLEDESGFVNVIVWSRVFEEHALLVKSESFLGVSGRLQVQEGVRHLIADCFWLPRLRSAPHAGRSRDFR
jgi:error-prone DNA polymerase